MKALALKYFLLILFCFFSSKTLKAQANSYKKDSLQIKVYSEIIYENSLVKSLKVKKIFCDYCSTNQLKEIKLEAWQRSYDERLNKKNRLENGKRKLALYIRISKKDFLELKEEENK